MTKREFTIEEFKDIFWEDGGDDFEIYEYEEWIDEGKYSTKTLVVKEKSTGKHYTVTCDRHGDHFSGYEYEWDYMDRQGLEVEQVEN